MSRLYTCEFEAQTVATASGDYELFELTPAANRPIQIEAYKFAVTSELTEAQEEWLRLRVIRGHTTPGTGGTGSLVPAPVNQFDAAAGFTYATLRTVIASAGTPVICDSDAFNVRAGHNWGPVPEEFGIQTSGSSLLVVRLVAAVADDLTMSGTIYVREY
jgi:hypothetical protein